MAPSPPLARAARDPGAAVTPPAARHAGRTPGRRAHRLAVRGRPGRPAERRPAAGWASPVARDGRAAAPEAFAPRRRVQIRDLALHEPLALGDRCTLTTTLELTGPRTGRLTVHSRLAGGAWRAHVSADVEMPAGAARPARPARRSAARPARTPGGRRQPRRRAGSPRPGARGARERARRDRRRSLARPPSRRGSLARWPRAPVARSRSTMPSPRRASPPTVPADRADGDSAACRRRRQRPARARRRHARLVPRSELPMALAESSAPRLAAGRHAPPERRPRPLADRRRRRRPTCRRARRRLRARR